MSGGDSEDAVESVRGDAHVGAVVDAGVALDQVSLGLGGSGAVQGEGVGHVDDGGDAAHHGDPVPPQPTVHGGAA